MKTGTKKTTHIEMRRLEGEFNRQFIQQAAELSELEYNTLVLDFGLEFLTETYGIDSEEYVRFSRMPFFWKWWKQEYFLWEQDLLKHCADAQFVPDAGFYKDEMRVLAHDRLTDHSFVQFLKACRNVKL